MLALSLDETAAEAKRFWADAGYSFPVAMRSDALHDAFGDINGTPTLYVVDRRGCLVKKQLGGIDPSELEAIIKRLL